MSQSLSGFEGCSFDIRLWTLWRRLYVAIPFRVRRVFLRNQELSRNRKP